MNDYRHFLKMTDDTGILQFSKLQNPDLHSGHTLDDNARALILSLYMPEGRELAYKYASFIDSCQQNEEGNWYNLFINRHYSSLIDSEDSIGRALLACGLGTLSKWDEVSQLCSEIFSSNLHRVVNFSSPRAIAYTLVAFAQSQGFKKIHVTNAMADYLLSLYQSKKGPNWYWFEDYLTYCNGILPQAMISVYEISGDKKYLKAGLDSLNFLTDILFRNGYLNIIGNQGWFHKGGKIPLFDQQPVDAASTAFACYEAYTVTAKSEYLFLAKLAQQWYKGANTHGMSLYDPETGGCYDALTADGVNLNQGAEAVLSLLLTDSLIQGSISKQSKIDKSS